MRSLELRLRRMHDALEEGYKILGVSRVMCFLFSVPSFQ